MAEIDRERTEYSDGGRHSPAFRRWDGWTEHEVFYHTNNGRSVGVQSGFRETLATIRSTADKTKLKLPLVGESETEALKRITALPDSPGFGTFFVRLTDISKDLIDGALKKFRSTVSAFKPPTKFHSDGAAIDYLNGTFLADALAAEAVHACVATARHWSDQVERYQCLREDCLAEIRELEKLIKQAEAEEQTDALKATLKQVRKRYRELTVNRLRDRNRQAKAYQLAMEAEGIDKSVTPNALFAAVGKLIPGFVSSFDPAFKEVPAQTLALKIMASLSHYVHDDNKPVWDMEALVKDARAPHDPEDDEGE